MSPEFPLLDMMSAACIEIRRDVAFNYWWGDVQPVPSPPDPMAEIERALATPRSAPAIRSDAEYLALAHAEVNAMLGWID